MSLKLQNEKKTAIKILNKYADSYNNLIEENKSLQSEIKDLRTNIKFNKDLLNELISSMGKTQKNNKNSNNNNSIYVKMTQEVNELYIQNEKLSKERNMLREKLLHYEELSSESYNKLKEDNEQLKNKVFLLEQVIFKKNNTISGLQNKLSKIKDNSIYEKETFVLEPSKAVIEINDELLLYKKIYNKLIKAIQRSKLSKERYETMVEELQKENMKLKRKYHLTIVSANRERETILSALSQNTRGATDNNVSYNNRTPRLLGRQNLSLLSEDKRLKSKLSINVNNKYDETDEFLEILKNCGLTYEKYLRMTQKAQNEKFVEIIEMMIKLLMDKNLSLEVLEKENSNLTVKNFELNKANMNLFTMNNQMKNSNSVNSNNKTNNDSLDNNTSTLTQNRNLVIKSLVTYEKVIEKEQKEINENIITSSELSDNNSTIKQVKDTVSGSFHSSHNNEEEEEEEEENENVSTVKNEGTCNQDTQSIKVNKSDNFECSSVSYRNSMKNDTE